MQKLKEILKTIKEKLFGNYAWIVDFTGEIPGYDIRKSKASAALGYFFFMIPMIFDDDRQFARFHCNQSILNLILSTVVAILWRMIPVVGPWLMIMQELLCIVFMIRGMTLAAKGKAVSIPLVGWITIVPYRYPGQ